ncbi:MAG: tRNA (guanosine(37)-N1)-methyltransferase TrmD [Tissierella sp.]|uniref:tRNA (guanosine(37)-N1)-methyltransferase TrmD n=1 Tax=Tissierella sp. TaxID=41274 RepID=UPI003F9DD415
MRIDILTLFPEFFSNLSNWSMIGKAIEKNILNLDFINIRDFSKNKHKKVDDYPFGGGSGMLMTPQPIYDAINSIKEKESKVIYMSPQGKLLDQDIINDLSKENHLILLCGHYEGIDNRVIENYVDDEISIGDYVLTGGEIPSMVIIDSVARLLPGVLKHEESYTEESHYEGLLEHPQYTRPREFNDITVPDVLLSGNHSKIEKWKEYESLKATAIKRPDLLKNIKLTNEEENLLLLIEEELNKNS